MAVKYDAIYILIFLLTVQDSDLIPHMEGQAISGTTLAAVAFEASASYEQIRPTYPLETVRFLLKKLGILEHNKIENYTFTRNLPLTVLELGSGTGKFTRVMFEILRGTGTQIIASDPTGTMIQQFQRVLPRIEILQCRAENIGKSGLIHFCVTLRNSSDYL